MECVDSQVRHCKKIVPELHLEGETLKPLDILLRNGNMFDAISCIFHIYGLQFFAFVADVGARLCCIP